MPDQEGEVEDEGLVHFIIGGQTHRYIMHLCVCVLVCDCFAHFIISGHTYRYIIMCVCVSVMVL